MKEDTTPIDPTWKAKTGGFAKDMTMRDYYAGLAMQAIRTSDVGDMISAYDLAVLAYQDADAMLKAREAK